MLDKEYVKVMIKELNDALATEINAWYQYLSGAYYIEGVFRYGIEKEFFEHANDELEHAKILMDRIHILGGQPIANINDLITRAKCGFKEPTPKDTLELVKHNIDAELCAIKHYRNLCKLALDNNDHSTYSILNQILEKEEEHARELDMFLDDFKRLTKKLKHKIELELDFD